MAWYWWVLIVVAAVVLGYLKLKIWNNIRDRHKKKTQTTLEEEE